MKIESTDLSLEKLLTGNYFVIPRFQRPYSWDEENIIDFWNDVTGEGVTDYFIGSMVVYKVGNNTLGVVDGQQRLTTIMIFLCALRDKFKNLGEDDKAMGLQSFMERTNRDNQKMFVLRTESSFPYFQEQILTYGKKKLDLEAGREEEALQKASAIFSERVAKKLNVIDEDPTISEKNKPQRKVEWLTSIRDVILELNIILITLDNEDDAYLIFETLNTRGKDLALSDLVRNLFARNLKPEGDVDHAKIKWDSVLEIIANSAAGLEPDSFIVHSWQSRFDAVTKAKAFHRIRESVTEKSAIEHLDDFIFDAKCYRSIFEPNYEWKSGETKIAGSLNAYRLFKVVQPTPAVLSLVRAYKTGKIKLGKLRKMLLAIENFHFGFTAVTSSRSSGGISGMYSSFGRRLFAAADSNLASREIRGLTKKLKDRVPVESEFDAAFEQIIYTHSATSQRALVRYILMKLLKYEELPILGATEELTIEHIVPQEAIGDEWEAGVVGQLGNLILVDEDTNEKLGTKEFAEKKTILLKRGYRIPVEFDGVKNLSENLIRSRTRNMAKTAREEVWRIK